MYYKAKISLTSTNNIRTFRIFEIDPKTGVRGKQIVKDTAILFVRNDTIIKLPNDTVIKTINDTIVQFGIDTVFNPTVKSYSTQFIVTKLTANKGIEIVVEDEDLMTYSKKLIVKISPKVVTSNVVTIETAEVYKGPYYASWLGGRAYFRHNGATYSNEIDFTLGNIAITGTDTVPAFISGDLRQEKGLLYLPNLRSCKFGLTTMNKLAFDAISNIDASVIKNLPAPTLSAIKIESAKVYVYENDTEKGLIFIGSIAAKTATLEQPNGTWVKRNNNYHELKIITKTAPKN
ncbi:hypothetical protein SDC9_112829 [bioreactor metagenome]|uniref:Uncharacterized protein n=1 Tax=bioreactor metagenome TaxID=1076179 RepID=A0A645BKP3_9ZZZZ